MNYLDSYHSLTRFQKVLNNNIYVDKSLLINEISQQISKEASMYICITRPRRFGKTINAMMLASYYTKGYNSHHLFDSLKISQTNDYEKHINQHHVFYIDLSKSCDECHSYHQYFQSIKNSFIESIEMHYPIKIQPHESINQFLNRTNDSFIFIFDEWDSVFYKTYMNNENKKEYMEFLKSLLKDQPYVDLAYMTGVLPITKYSSGSELNIFREYNFINDPLYNEYFGFSEEEVKELCKRYRKPTYNELQYWYNGYYSNDGHKIFNPRSVTNALDNGVCQNYWTDTGPMNEIADCIEHNIDEVREDIVKLVAKIPIHIQLDGYSATNLQLHTREEILSAMVVFGFLSYHDEILTIPNHELMQKFVHVLSRESMQSVKQIVSQSKEMLEATLALDSQKVAYILENVHDQEIPFLNYNDENSLSCVITLCYLYARNDYDIYREAKSGKGYVDYLFIPKTHNKPAIVLELKNKKSAYEAIQQIKEKDYINQVKHYKEIILVGISYDGYKHHDCIIEKIDSIHQMESFCLHINSKQNRSHILFHTAFFINILLNINHMN